MRKARPFMLAGLLIAAPILVLRTIPPAQSPAAVLPIQQELAREWVDGMRWGNIADVRGWLTASYIQRDWQPLWIINGQLSPAGRAVVQQLVMLNRFGLDSTDHETELLLRRMDSLPTLPAEDQARYEIALSVAAGRALEGLAIGRVDPQRWYPNLPRRAAATDGMALLTALSGGANADSVFHVIQPNHPRYLALVNALGRLREAMEPFQDTLAAKNIERIELALERWRWLPQPRDTAYIEVNLAAQRLVGWEADTAVLVMNVIIGKPPRFATPMMRITAGGIQFNPPWRVPTSIAREELLPRLQRDPSIMTREGFDLFVRDSQIAPTAANLQRVGRGVELRQRPGPLNPLGRIKVMMPNAGNVFLHDTPARTLFADSSRMRSHGCVRVAAPVALAQFLSRAAGRDSTAWPSRRPETVTAEFTFDRRIPIIITYLTAAIGPDGRLEFHADRYGADERLMTALRTGYPYQSVEGTVPTDSVRQ